MTRHNQLNLLFLLFVLSACVNTRKATNFNDLQDGVIPTAVAFMEPSIQKGDILSIVISSQNPDATLIFNAPVATPEGNQTMGSGYLVNSEGMIQLPVLGLIKAEGLSKKSLGDQIRQALLDKKLLIDPVVAIRHLNYRVTVLGEVSNPAVINVPSERITVLEALGMAGDMTIYAKRDNILLIREAEGKRLVRRLDLTDKDFLKSPYYFMQPNDVLYVEPNKAKVAGSTRTAQILPIILSGITVLAIGLDRLTR